MDDAAIPREHPALGFRDDIAHGCDAILQRHGLKTAARMSSTGWLEPSYRFGPLFAACLLCLRSFQVAPSVPTVRAFGDRGKIAAVQADIAEFHVGEMI
jgi:hypothetical protein